ncbi:hypothetical protein HRI_000147600 [Hibiscus trionum]|uniref:Uncharacterized protein n=1 Tax=Hibiscus trionum TaxID=183268 RepID=A0A9W7GT25_HIBTR|nr:hypothetical protein HRI_000147600 [Hibiscus trionum]
MGDADLAALQHQMDEMKKDKDTLKDKMDRFDTRMDEVQEDMRKIIEAMIRMSESLEPVTPEKNKQTTTNTQSKHEGKKPMVVTYIDNHESFSMNLEFCHLNHHSLHLKKKGETPRTFRKKHQDRKE